MCPLVSPRARRSSISGTFVSLRRLPKRFRSRLQNIAVVVENWADEATLEGPIALRGAVYDQYGSGGWTAGRRQEMELSPLLADQVRERLNDGSLAGRLLSLTVQVEAKSVVGTVLFSPGEPVSRRYSANGRTCQRGSSPSACSAMTRGV